MNYSRRYRQLEKLTKTGVDDMRVNNHYCTDKCDYRTFGSNEEEATTQLIADGVRNDKNNTLCPKCGKDSVVFVDESYKETV